MELPAVHMFLLCTSFCSAHQWQSNLWTADGSSMTGSRDPLTRCILHTSAGIQGVSSFHIAAAGTSLLILPMLFIQSFKRLSWLNMVGFTSTMVVTATMLLLVAVDPFREHMPAQVRCAASVLRCKQHSGIITSMLVLPYPLFPQIQPDPFAM